jgi:hypothetical protein
MRITLLMMKKRWKGNGWNDVVRLPEYPYVEQHLLVLWHRHSIQAHRRNRLHSHWLFDAHLPRGSHTGLSMSPDLCQTYSRTHREGINKKILARNKWETGEKMFTPQHHRADHSKKCDYLHHTLGLHSETWSDDPAYSRVPSALCT